MTLKSHNFSALHLQVASVEWPWCDDDLAAHDREPRREVAERRWSSDRSDSAYPTHAAHRWYSRQEGFPAAQVSQLAC